METNVKMKKPRKLYPVVNMTTGFIELLSLKQMQDERGKGRYSISPNLVAYESTNNPSTGV